MKGGSTSRRVWAVVAGGGTAGHAVPAVAIGQALVERGHSPGSLHYVGSRRGLEAKMVPAAGFRITLLPGRGIARKATPANLKAVAGLAAATLKALWLLASLRPAVVVTVGGYASVATALAALLLRIPLVVAEQNAVPGLANRLAGRFARACAVSFPSTSLPRAVLTGNPVRREILSASRTPEARAAAREQLGLPVQAKVVAVAGGSLGARRINLATVELARLWGARKGVAIRHVAGERDFEEVHRLAGESPAPPGGLVYQVVPFEERMDLLLSAADVAVQRAGASTVAELAVVGVPSILVPLPGAPADHQTANALRMVEAGAAVMVPDAELTGERLGEELDALLGDLARLEAMSVAARSMARPGAAAAVAVLAELHARADRASEGRVCGRGAGRD